MTDKLVPLKGSVPVNKNQLIGPADQKARIEVTIKLRRKSEDGLPTLQQFIKGKRSKGITRPQLAQLHGAKQEDVDAVQSWAVKHGLSVFRIDLGTRQMHLVGSVDAMSKAFGVKLSVYKHSRTGTSFRCPENNIHVPQDLAPIITGVFGLNDMPVVVRRRHHPQHHSRLLNADVQGEFPGSFYPNQVAKLYNFPPTQGAGQRVAILEFGGGFDQEVLAEYFKNNIGLMASPTVNAISVLGTKMDVSDPATGEVYLDIEVVGAMAPRAMIDVYFAPWTGEGFLNAIDQAIHNDDYAAVSISYGLDEDLRGTANDPGWPMLNQNVDEAFRDAVAVGIPVFVSSGDQGSSSLRGQLSNGMEITLFSKTPHAGYPATSPYATAVGGTLLYAENDSISKEVVWNELGAIQQEKFYFGGATGGGSSDHYPVPSYQNSTGIKLEGRGVPDVAGNAGSTTGYLVSQPPGSQIPIAPVGGTSAAAPMWAALMACIREALNATFNSKVPVFFFNDFVYANGKSEAFRDIVEGRAFTFDPQNGPVGGKFIPIGNNCSTQVNCYNAAKGYDLCTGWGSPNGVQLLKQLQSWLQTQQSAPVTAATK